MPGKIGTLRKVKAPINWKCKSCKGSIPAGTECWKAGKDIYCDNCLYVAIEEDKKKRRKHI